MTAKDVSTPYTPRAGQRTLEIFIDARHVFRQIDHARRDWTPAQIGFLANVVRLYRGEEIDVALGGDEAAEKLREVFGKKPKYADVAGLCNVATRNEIEGQGWGLNPGRYVEVAPGSLTAEARKLEKVTAKNAAEVLEL
jgi:type I restriction enzyme M protein